MSNFDIIYEFKLLAKKLQQHSDGYDEQILQLRFFLSF